MKHEKGPEDQPNWKKSKTTPVVSCRICKKTIVARHCENPGCSWCASCGEAAKFTRD